LNKDLEILMLDWNFFTRVPKDISIFKNLKTLTLRYNNVSRVTKHLAELSNTLTELKLSNNYIESLPESLSALTNLTVSIIAVIWPNNRISAH